MSWTWFGWSSHKQDDPAVTIRGKTGKESREFLERLRADGYRVELHPNDDHPNWMMARQGQTTWTMFTKALNEGSMKSVNHEAR